MSEIPRGVLSDEFHRLVDGRKVRAAVFLTFRFDPGFFEQEVLPAFLDVPLSHVPEIRLLNLADALRQVDSIAVYYDRRGLEAGAQSGKLDVQRIAVSPPRGYNGYFHPKNVLVLVENERDGNDSSSMSLIVGSLSANLTRAGWWENIEVAHIEEVEEGEACSFADDLRQLVALVRRTAPPETEQQALQAIDAFVRRIPQDAQRMRDRLVLPRFFSGPSFIDFLVDIAGSRLQRCNLEILSPYFDATETSAGALSRLKEAFKPREIRVYLPRGLDHEALCSEGYFAATRAMADWGSLPKELTRLSKSAERTLHAKVYRFFDRDYEAFFVGSVNLTSPAFNPGGNVESGFFVETAAKHPKWWLEVDKTVPATFMHRKEDEGLPQGNGYKLSLRYDWQSEICSAFWDTKTPSPPMTLLAHGVEIGQLAPLEPQRWTVLPSTFGEALHRELKSSSFITVRIVGQEDTQILVDELRMTHKPSLMSTLTANDILRYWSLLTAEQKKEFLEEHAEDVSADPEMPLWISGDRRPDTTESFFSTFTEVYVSFGNLERTVAHALGEKREREAVDRLFGRKFDSLRRLLEQVFEELQGDAVRSYITVLCARQLIDTLDRNDPEFSARNKSDMKVMRTLIDRAGEIRQRFQLIGDSDAFLSWFDRWFITRAQPVEQVKP